MTISQKQLEANKKNAKKGGVKTEEGKAIVKYNALRHGLLAKEIVITVGEGAENPEEFNALLEDLKIQLTPAGTLEEMLTEKIAVASHGDSLDATLSQKGEVCTSFVLVDPQTMDSEVVRIEPADSPVRASVQAVRAAAKSGATVVITPEIRPTCCTALRALAITVALADESLTVREAVAAYGRGELISPPYL